jgi:2-dehydro-3-deoxygluconokinase
MTSYPADRGAAGTVVTFGEPLVAALPPAPLPLEQSPTLRLFVGGAEVNFAIGMRRLGFDTCLVGHVGDDPPGRFVQQVLNTEGIELSHLGVRPLPTGLYLREWLSDGERRPYYYRSGSASASFTAADWPQEIAGAAWLHLTGITPALSKSCLEATLAALSWAKARSIPVSFDPNYRPRLWGVETARTALRPLIAGCNVLLLGLDEANLLFGSSTVSDAAAAASALGPGLVVIKQGAAGASAWRNGHLSHQPALATVAADPVGAGDAFDAGCIAALMHGSPLAEALALGAYCGSRVAEVPGEHTGFPLRESIPQSLQRAVRSKLCDDARPVAGVRIRHRLRAYPPARR